MLKRNVPTTKENADLVDMKYQSQSDISVTLAQALANRRLGVVCRKNCFRFLITLCCQFTTARKKLTKSAQLTKTL